MDLEDELRKSFESLGQFIVDASQRNAEARVFFESLEDVVKPDFIVEQK